MNIEEVKKGQRIEAAKINEIITGINERYENSSLIEGSESFSLPQGGTSSYKEFAPMWSCKQNNGDGNFTIRGGNVVILRSKVEVAEGEEVPSTREEITVPETQISGGECPVYVTVDVVNKTAIITIEEGGEDTQNIVIGYIISNANGFLYYKQLSKAEIYVSDISNKISLIGRDNITIAESTYNDIKIFEIGLSPLMPDYSFIAEDDIKITVKPDNNPKITDVIIGCKRISFIAGDNICILESEDKDIRTVTIQASAIEQDYISFCSGDNISIQETQINGGRNVTISANVPSVIVPDYSFIGDDNIDIKEETFDNGKKKVITFSFIKPDSYEFDPVFFSIDENGIVSFNLYALDDLIAEAVSEIQIEVEAVGVYRNISGHGELYYNLATSNASIDSAELDSEMTYDNPATE